MGACTSTAHPTTAATGSTTDAAPSFDYERQLHSSGFGPYSVAVNPHDKLAGETAIHRSPATASSDLCTAVYPTEPRPVLTIWDGFQRGLRTSAAQPCLGTRAYTVDPATGLPAVAADGSQQRGDYVWSSYSEVEAEAKEVGAGLVALGLRPSESNVAIYAKNRHEWVAAALGLWSQSMRCVALYDTFGQDSLSFIVQQADIAAVLVSRENLPTLLRVVADCPNVTHVVQFDERAHWSNAHERVAQADVDAFAAVRGIRLLGYSAVRALGAQSTTVFPVLPQPQTISYIMYTSGTTGNPKGVILTHAGLCSSVAASRDTVPFQPHDVHLSYLPLAHIFECGLMCVMLFAGGRIGFWSGNIKLMNSDLLTLRPTALFGVPRVFQRIYQRVIAQIAEAGGLKAKLANHALASSSAALRAGNTRPNGFLAAKVFGGIRGKLGLDRCKVIVIGAAPCPAYILEFFTVLLDAVVIQGYGMTETHCVIASTRAGDVTRGHVGGPLACCEVKLVDVPDMAYLATDQPCPRGEIWVRGPQLFKGYYKNDEETAAVLTEDGWLKTGDVGRWNENGSLSIIDRKKNILKLSQGEYVPVEKIEAIYGKCAAISAIFLYGNSYKSFIVGIVVPAADHWVKHFRTHNLWPATDPPTHVGDAAFPAAFAAVWQQHEADLNRQLVAQLRAYERDLAGFERAKDWIVEYRLDRDGSAWTPANGLMTPTFKVRRPQMVHHYVAQLKQLYANNGEPAARDERWPGE